MKKIIKINHIAKMEGHTDFEGALRSGQIAEAKLMTTEGMRLFEAILTGRKFYEAPIITARICGICPVVHSLNTIKAIEDAFSYLPSKQTVKLRKLMEITQVMHSHALHLYFLSMPDFVGVADDLDFIKKNPTEAQAAIASREFALKILKVVAGRVVHPITCEVGGFKVLPTKKQLSGLLDLYPNALEAAKKLFNFAKKLKIPEFERPMEFMALSANDGYAIYDGIVKSLSNRKFSAKKYIQAIEELQLPGLAAKHANYQGKSFMVGALARLNINHSKLNKEAKTALKSLKLKFPVYNTFYNVIAQAIELIHCTEEAGKLLKDLSKTIKPETSFSEKLKLIGFANPKNKTTVGYSVMEAPRGILFDMLEIDSNGYIVKSNIITPTVQFLNNIEEDLKIFIPQTIKMSDQERNLKIKTLIRAYDPCISCATH